MNELSPQRCHTVLLEKKINKHIDKCRNFIRFQNFYIKMDPGTNSDNDMQVVAVNPLYSSGSSSSEVTADGFTINPVWDPYCDIPDSVFIRIFQFLSLRSLKSCRSVNRRWYQISLSHKVLQATTCFVVDGRSVDQNGSRVQTQLQESRHGLQPWSTLRLQKCSFDQLSWMTRSVSCSITQVEFNNCSISWSNMLRLLGELPSLMSFADVQDMYCWDYITFSQGLESEIVTENPGYQGLNLETLEHLGNLKRVEIHRSQLTDCTLYMKIFHIFCGSLEYLSVTTDQALSPRPTQAFYTCLGQLIRKNSHTLRSLWFPYKSVYPIYEVRIADDHFPFRDFLVFVTENRWGQEIQPKRLTELGIQFPVIHIEQFFFKDRLLPFLSSWSTVQKLILNCVYLEPEMETLVLESIPPNVEPQLGLWWSDVRTGRVPSVTELKGHTKTMTIQPFRHSLGRQLRDYLPLYDPDDPTQTQGDAEACSYPAAKELQFFSKSPHFRFFNVELITATFKLLTHLNLVDHNSRIDRNHASDSPCTLEDEDFQLIIANLRRLTFLQLIGNLVYLTDRGITGIIPSVSRRMLKTSSFEVSPGDRDGLPLNQLKSLKTLILRGVGIKVTDVSAHFGFCEMPNLRKLHMYGAQQITPAGRAYLQTQCWCARGCDVQV